jgi:hypothetical protein
MQRLIAEVKSDGFPGLRSPVAEWLQQEICGYTDETGEQSNS